MTEVGMKVAMLYYGRLFIQYGQMSTGNLVSFILYQQDLGDNIRVYLCSVYFKRGILCCMLYDPLCKPALCEMNHFLLKKMSNKYLSISFPDFDLYLRRHAELCRCGW